jgi:N-acetylmuramoyl-L-alanine amidase
MAHRTLDGLQRWRRVRGALVGLACLGGGVTSAAVAQQGVAPNAPSPAQAVAVAARSERTSQGARLVFDLTHAVEARAFVLENPDRVVVETSTLAFQVDPRAGQPGPRGLGPVKAFRFGSFAPGRSRIVIDLGSPVRVARVASETIGGSAAAHLTIDLARADRADFHAAVVKAAALDTPAPPAPAVSAPVGDKPVIVIDPGHGGIDPGATGLGGIVEKQLTFEFASTLAAKLTASGRYTVVLTRSGDSFISLRDRVKITRDVKAALFLSIHADTVADGYSVSGATVYTASDTASDSEAARLADKENKADQEAGLEASGDASEVSDILFDLTRRETRTYSHAYQRTLAGYWQKMARLNKNPERAAGFWVLKAPDVPSVLLELGYLSSASDVAALTSPQWRDKASGAVAASIDTFFANRTSAERAATLDRTSGPDATAIVALRPHL